ncbi:IS30 family transposase [Antrihabitans sp. YC3-6]|uniref:IS30 family transposase n=1 Tax=Antrihabitans stalagmiti TaxID=2799499 RepID=A0A934NV97_9NOCA|nr:IS30 family transposase [Antrihabitans stalagmiti]MBJ8342223.1 IS30 family transposase [Antrihabitans stalagmiti]
MQLSYETVYLGLYVQSRGGLKRALVEHLRSDRALRSGSGEQRGKALGKISIVERPAEPDDRSAVPGHWEADLIMGASDASAIGTLVERRTRFVMLLHLPDGYSAEQVRAAMARKIVTLPRALTRPISRRQSAEISQHAQFAVGRGIQIYFCDPRSPWLRGSNENTNGLLRQYFPKGTDLSVHSSKRLDFVADQLNGRPRETLEWENPAERLNKLLVAASS